MYYKEQSLFFFSCFWLYLNYRQTKFYYSHRAFHSLISFFDSFYILICIYLWFFSPNLEQKIFSTKKLGLFCFYLPVAWKVGDLLQINLPVFSYYLWSRFRDFSPITTLYLYQITTSIYTFVKVCDLKMRKWQWYCHMTLLSNITHNLVWYNFLKSLF